MAKLIFEDDKGNQHNLNIVNIPTKSLGPGDVLVASYEVGHFDPLPSASDVSRVLTQLKGLLESVVPDGVKILTIATRNGKEDVGLKVLKSKAKNIKEETQE
jgi:hypothetical protein